MPMAAMAGASVLGPVLGGIIGNMAASDDREAAMNAAKEAMAIIDAVGAPPDLSKKIIFEKFKQAGVLNPEMEQAINLGVSKVSQIQENPELLQSQLGSLSALNKIASDGLRPEDRAAFNQLRSQVANDTQAKTAQIMQNFAARGQAGSGAELAAALSSNQAGAQQASAGGDNIAANASARALQAIMQGGGLASQIRGQDFDVNRTRSSAEDAFNQFNTSNAIARQQRNVSTGNAAQNYNLNNAQRIQDTNTQQENAERLRQVEAQRQFWQDKMAQATAKAGARTGMVPMYQQEAQRKAQMFSGIGNAIGQGASAYGNYKMGQDNQQMMGAAYGLQKDGNGNWYKSMTSGTSALPASTAADYTQV